MRFATIYKPKIYFILHICLCLKMLYACQTTNQHTQNENGSQQDSVAPAQPLHLSQGTEAQHKWHRNNCPRGIPSPTLSLQNPNIVGKNFVLQPDAGVEKAKLFNGDSLTIENHGCEYYTLTYTLKSFSAPDARLQDAAYWFGRSADLLLALQDSDVPFDYRSTSESIRNLGTGKALKILEEYTLGNNGTISQKVVMEEFGKLQHGKGGYMKFKLFIGPL